MGQIAKRLIGLLLAACMAVTMLPAKALAEDVVDFNALLSGEQTVYFEGANDPIAVFHGLFVYSQEATYPPPPPVPVQQTLFGVVNGYRAVVVANSRADGVTEAYFSLAFAPSQDGRSVYFRFFAPTSTIGMEMAGSIRGGKLYSSGGAGQGEPVGVSGPTLGVLIKEKTLLILYYPSANDPCIPIVLHLTGALEEGETLALPEWVPIWDDVIAQYTLHPAATLYEPSGDDDSDSAAQAAAERAFWQELIVRAGAAPAGAVLDADAIRYETIPFWAVNALAGQNVILKLTYLDAEGNRQTVEVDCARIARTEPNRVFYRLYDFAGLYAPQN